MSKVDTIYNWVNENLGKVHFTKEQKITRVGLTVNKTTKNGEVTEDSTLSFTLDGGNLISLKDKWIDKIALAENKQSMIVLLTDESPLRDINDGVFMLSNDPSFYDEEEEEEEEEIDEISKNAEDIDKEDGESDSQIVTDVFGIERPTVNVIGHNEVKEYLEKMRKKPLAMIQQKKEENEARVYILDKNSDNEFVLGKKDATSSNGFMKRWINDTASIVSPPWAEDEEEVCCVCGFETRVSGGEITIYEDRIIIFPYTERACPIQVMKTVVENEEAFKKLFHGTKEVIGNSVDGYSSDNAEKELATSLRAICDGVREGKINTINGEARVQEIVENGMKKNDIVSSVNALLGEDDEKYIKGNDENNVIQSLAEAIASHDEEVEDVSEEDIEEDTNPKCFRCIVEYMAKEGVDSIHFWTDDSGKIHCDVTNKTIYNVELEDSDLKK